MFVYNIYDTDAYYISNILHGWVSDYIDTKFTWSNLKHRKLCLRSPLIAADSSSIATRPLGCTLCSVSRQPTMHRPCLAYPNTLRPSVYKPLWKQSRQKKSWRRYIYNIVWHYHRYNNLSPFAQTPSPLHTADTIFFYR